jgi:hypothetical protein
LILAISWSRSNPYWSRSDLYLDWREEPAAVADAYARWAGAPAGEEGRGFAAYAAALDREEAAARGYADALANGERYRLLGLIGAGGVPETASHGPRDTRRWALSGSRTISSRMRSTVDPAGSVR